MKTHWNIQTSVGKFVKDNVLCAKILKICPLIFALEEATLSKRLAGEKILSMKKYCTSYNNWRI